MRRNTAVINFCEYHSQCIELSLSSGRKGSEWEEDSDSRCWLALKKKHLLVKTESTVILIHCQGKASFSSSTLHKQASKTKGQRDAYIRGYLFGFPTAWAYPLENSRKIRQAAKRFTGQTRHGSRENQSDSWEQGPTIRKGTSTSSKSKYSSFSPLRKPATTNISQRKKAFFVHTLKSAMLGNFNSMRSYYPPLNNNNKQFNNLAPILWQERKTLRR